MSNQDRLLSDEELVAEIWSGIVKHDSLAANNIGWPSQKTEKLLADLINTQKRLYAESVIGENCQGGHDDWEISQQCDIENRLRAEQRARIKLVIALDDAGVKL